MKGKYLPGSLFVCSFFLLFLTACDFFPQFRTDQTNTPVSQVPTEVSESSSQTLRYAAAHSSKRNILIGTAANMDAFNTDATYKKLLGQEFNLLTPENVLKMDTIHPDIDTFDFSKSDQLVAFAEAHHMQIEGSSIIWHDQIPDWITHGGYTRQELLGILKDYIQTVVGHYKGKIKSWFVVNEPLETSFWEQMLGPDYITNAFRWTHEADPQAKLYVNEYGIEMPGTKTNRYYHLVQELISQGVPVSGVGSQSHLNLTRAYNLSQMIANLQRFADLGVQVEITEVDVRTQNLTASMAEKLKQEARLYAMMISTCQAVKACDGIVIWGITDRYTWINSGTHGTDVPLIFDDQYRPKAAYYAVQNALLGKQ
ncbi:endo-1,4-beta-xylanase [Ktedonobacter racemifer]|uniref:Beta-xylanase n=1 Tax=Ktedonobacter racemifer DSM 44963 TaxID=485913 RepID=D6TBL5_KTERA|nr:endo-1,4-beta-xylanase [Ktedonobacter racemifer]EFH87999.1 Endo-1,4-beta-xylanase [Ktedonobacter racemifer DSM 44963]